MTTVDDQLREHADYLEELARAVRTINERLGSADRAALRVRLGVGGPDRGGLVPGATGEGLRGGYLGGYSGSPSVPTAANTLGNTQPAVGQANLLSDPTMRLVTLTALSVSEKAASNELFVKSTLAAGSAPSTNTIDQVPRTDTTVNRFGSSQAAMAITGAATPCDLTNEVYTKAVLTVGADGLPYLVGAVRTYRYPTPWDATNVTALAVTLELVRNLVAAPVVVSSAVVDLLAMPKGETVQLVVSSPAPLSAGDTYDLRVKIHFVTTGSPSTNLKFALVEPQLHWAYTPDPHPYVPEWLPDFTFGGDGSDGAVTVDSGAFSAGPITANALTRDAYFTDFTLAAGFVLDTKGYRIFCTGVAIINGTLRCNGGAGGNGGSGAGTGGAAGAAASAAGAPMQTTPGQAGDPGVSPGTGAAATAGRAAVQVLPSVGSPAQGGGGGGVAAAGASTTQAPTPNGARQFVTIVTWATIANGVWTVLNGSDQAGAGGRGDADGTNTSGSGGGSGGAGGIIVLVARLIAGSGAFEVRGGNGGNGGNGVGVGATGGGGGSGGSGGTVFLLSSASTFSGTISRSAGAAGAAGLAANGVTPAGVGAAGTIGPAGRHFFVLNRVRT